MRLSGAKYVNSVSKKHEKGNGSASVNVKRRQGEKQKERAGIASASKELALQSP